MGPCNCTLKNTKNRNNLSLFSKPSVLGSKMLVNLFYVDVTLEDSELVTKFTAVHTSQETVAGSLMGHQNYMISRV